MKKLRSPRRSVSPFGTVLASPVDPFSALKEKIYSVAKPVSGKPKLETWDDLAHIPFYLEKMLDAPSNELAVLDTLCNFLIGHRADLDQAGLGDLLFSALEHIFKTKTEDFFLSDTVLFSKERDALIGRYFVPITEQSPGQFSGFLSRWIETDRIERLLHFFDFCKGSNNPTFEYFLVFSNPSFHRVLTNKPLLRALLTKVEPLMKKLPSDEWEKLVREALKL